MSNANPARSLRHGARGYLAAVARYITSLDRPDTPLGLFRPDPEDEEDTLLVIRKKPGVIIRDDEVVQLRAALQQLVGGRGVVVSIPEAR
jgi:hypothetical protein